MRARAEGLEAFAVGLLLASCVALGACGDSSNSPDAASGGRGGATAGTGGSVGGFDGTAGSASTDAAGGGTGTTDAGTSDGDAAPGGHDAAMDSTSDVMDSTSDAPIGDGAGDLAPSDVVGDIGDAAAGDTDGGLPISVACNDPRPLTGDYDGDGITDCVVMGAHALAFHKGLGGGTVKADAIVSANLACVPPGYPLQVAADLNGDGRDDLVLIIVNGNDAVRPYLTLMIAGRDDGTFLCPPVADSPTALASAFDFSTFTLVKGDFTGDGLPDLLMVGFTPTTFGPLDAHVVQWIVLSGTRLSARLAAMITDSGFAVGALGSVKSISAPDVNTDGHLDVVAQIFVQYLNGTGPGARSETAYGKGNGTFSPTP